MIKIIVIDDHDLVRTGLSRILDEVEGFSVIATADSGEKALKLARQLAPDVMMMDVKMPGMGGVEATKRIKLANSHIKLIAVTSCDDDLYPSKLMRAGASAYLTKRATPEEMIEAVNKVVAGKTYMSSEIARATEQQAEAANEANVRINALSGAADNSLRTADELASASQALRARCLAIMDIANRFKL